MDFKYFSVNSLFSAKYNFKFSDQIKISENYENSAMKFRDFTVLADGVCNQLLCNLQLRIHISEFIISKKKFISKRKTFLQIKQ